MKKILLSIALCLNIVAMQAQEETVDAKAGAILQSLSKRTRSYKSIKAEFNIIMYGRENKITDNQKGNLIVKGGKYRLEVKNQVVVSDSNTMWTYLKDANEVQINTVDHSADKGAISPTNIFTIYEKGFKSQLKGETTEKGASIAIIDLFPKHPEKEKYHTIELKIDKTKNQIVELKVFMKDGTIMEYTIDTFTTDGDLPANTFTFNPKDYPGIDVEDLRE
ncbi:MAG TPA: outer membrane lipoprotein carrier protein LolA [Bacteroidia bacterium]|nr:outer membrane lipoprotein carrier protein LolA [Bacteroidia bacterium]